MYLIYDEPPEAFESLDTCHAHSGFADVVNAVGATKDLGDDQATGQQTRDITCSNIRVTYKRDLILV